MDTAAAFLGATSASLASLRGKALPSKLSTGVPDRALDDRPPTRLAAGRVVVAAARIGSTEGDRPWDLSGRGAEFVVCDVKDSGQVRGDWYLQPVDSRVSFQFRDRALPMGKDQQAVLRQDTGTITKWQAGQTLFAARDFYDAVFAELARNTSSPPEKALQANAKMDALFKAWTVQASSPLDVLDQIHDTLTEIGAKSLHCIIDEAETLDVDTLQLELRWVYQRRLFRVDDNEAFSPDQLSVTLAGDAMPLLIGSAARREVEIRVPEWIFEEAAVPVSQNDEGFIERRFADRDERQDGGWLGGQLGAFEALSIPEVENLTAEQVEVMKPNQLRRALAKLGIPTKSRSSADALRATMMPFLDEVQRRRMKIEQAVENEDYKQAASLTESKSRRHKVMEQLEQAMADGRYLEVSELQKELDILTSQRADPTQDEGSYDSYLDQDEWYRPAR